MFDALTSNAINQIATVKKLVANHESMQDGLDAVERKNIKLYAVSSCATRLYAIYENFVHQVVSDYLDAIPELKRFATLSAGFQQEYRIGISYLLGRLDHARYHHLKHENVIGWYHGAITNTTPYRFVAEALIRHEENLRLQVVDSLLSRVQLPGIREWISNHGEVLALYTEHTAVHEQLEAELRNFVQLRNDAAHGNIADLVGPDAQLRFCDMIESLILAIASYIHRCVLHMREEAGKVKRIGKVTEVFPRKGVFIAQIDSRVTVQVGLQVHFIGLGYCGALPIMSLQLDDEPIAGFTSTQPNLEVGVRVSGLPKKNAEIYIDA